MFVKVKMNNTKIKFLLDIGSAVILIIDQTWNLVHQCN